MSEEMTHKAIGMNTVGIVQIETRKKNDVNMAFPIRPRMRKYSGGKNNARTIIRYSLLFIDFCCTEVGHIARPLDTSLPYAQELSIALPRPIRPLCYGV